MSADRVQITHQMIELYNAQDADGYVEFMTDDACEAGYRGAVVRDGREGVRDGLKAMFAQFPENRADILSSYELGDYVVLHVGCALQRLDPEEAEETLRVMAEAGMLPEGGT